jgi:hypothetical protein
MGFWLLPTAKCSGVDLRRARSPDARAAPAATDDDRRGAAFFAGVVFAVAAAIDFEVEFDVGRVPESKTADGEIGAAKDGLGDALVVDMVELAVKQIGLGDGADFYFAANPVCALAGNGFLLEAIGENEAGILDLKCLFICFSGVEGRNETGFAEQEAEFGGGLELSAECVVGENREVGGDNGQVSGGLDFGFEVVTNGATRAVIANS